MADFQKMYIELFNAVTDAIHMLQKSQQTTEDIYMSEDDTILTIMSPDIGGENRDDDQT